MLEYVAGGSLAEGLGPAGGLGEERARRCVQDVVAGLIYLHQQNVVHGDIKPENLLVGANGHIKICDFGLSHTFEGNDDRRRRCPGTPVYTAPECCLGELYHGRLADVWALGCTLFVLLFGQYPFIGATASETYDKIVKEELKLPPHLSPDLSSLLSGLLHKDPTQRLSLEAVASHPWVQVGFVPVRLAKEA